MLLFRQILELKFYGWFIQIFSKCIDDASWSNFSLNVQRGKLVSFVNNLQNKCVLKNKWIFKNFSPVQTIMVPPRETNIRKLLSAFFRTGKNRLSGTKSLLLKVSSEERCASHNFVLLVMLGGTHFCFFVYLTMYEME